MGRPVPHRTTAPAVSQLLLLTDRPALEAFFRSLTERLDLPAAVYGPDSHVLLYERVGATSRPPATQDSGGTYSADLAVNMIHVHIADQLPLVAGYQPLEVIVSHADAHADFPQTTRCPGSPNQAVSGHAFIGSEITKPGGAARARRFRLDPVQRRTRSSGPRPGDAAEPDDRNSGE